MGEKYKPAPHCAHSSQHVHLLLTMLLQGCCQETGSSHCSKCRGGTEYSPTVSSILLDLLSAEVLLKISAGCALVLGAPMTWGR